MSMDSLLQKLAKPAQRALLGAGITTLEQLAAYREADVRALHGIGKNALAVIRETLQEHGLSFKDS